MPMGDQNYRLYKDYGLDIIDHQQRFLEKWYAEIGKKIMYDTSTIWNKLPKNSTLKILRDKVVKLERQHEKILETLQDMKTAHAILIKEIENWLKPNNDKIKITK